MGTFSRHSTSPCQRITFVSPIFEILFDREFQVHVDASEEGVGAFLAQPTNSKTSDQEVDSVAYYSQRFKSGQRHYSASMNKRCAVVLALTHWRPFFKEKSERT